MLRNFQLINLRTEVAVTQIQLIPNFLHLHEIEAIKEMAQTVDYEKGAIMGATNGSGLVFRDSKVKWLLWNDDNWWLYNKIMDKVRLLNNEFWQFDLYGINEYLQYTEYESKPSGRGHYDYHMDLAHNGIASNRKLSFECVLEDDYEGGEFSTLIGPTEQKVKIKKGDAIFYPSFLMSKIYPVRSGKRSSIVSWISGPSFK